MRQSQSILRPGAHQRRRTLAASRKGWSACAGFGLCRDEPDLGAQTGNVNHPILHPILPPEAALAEILDDSLPLNLPQDIGAEQRDQRTLPPQSADYSRRIKRRLDALNRRTGELRDALDLMIKAELMGRPGHFETQIAHAPGNLSGRLGGRSGVSQL